jgi:hypothetical protein
MLGTRETGSSGWVASATVNSPIFEDVQLATRRYRYRIESTEPFIEVSKEVVRREGVVMESLD